MCYHLALSCAQTVLTLGPAIFITSLSYLFINFSLFMEEKRWGEVVVGALYKKKDKRSIPIAGHQGLVLSLPEALGSRDKTRGFTYVCEILQAHILGNTNGQILRRTHSALSGKVSFSPFRNVIEVQRWKVQVTISEYVRICEISGGGWGDLFSSRGG